MVQTGAGPPCSWPLCFLCVETVPHHARRTGDPWATEYLLEGLRRRVPS